eukprot:SAG31_NODE_2884_length_4954_cov_2.669619_4_plen_129_part_00
MATTLNHRWREPSRFCAGNGDGNLEVGEVKRVMIGVGKKRAGDAALKAQMQKLCADANIDSGKGLFKRLDLDGDDKILKTELVLALDEVAGLWAIFSEIVSVLATNDLLDDPFPSISMFPILRFVAMA